MIGDGWMPGYDRLAVEMPPGTPRVLCPRCGPAHKEAHSYRLRDPLPPDCPLPPALRFMFKRGGGYWMCDDCAKEGERWFERAEVEP